MHSLTFVIYPEASVEQWGKRDCLKKWQSNCLLVVGSFVDKTALFDGDESSCLHSLASPLSHRFLPYTANVGGCGWTGLDWDAMGREGRKNGCSAPSRPRDMTASNLIELAGRTQAARRPLC